MASSQFNMPLKTKFISATATTSASLAGSTGYYIADFDIPTISGIKRNRIRGFLPTFAKDVNYSDWVVYVGMYDFIAGIGTVKASREVFLQGYVLYE